MRTIFNITVKHNTGSSISKAVAEASETLQSTLMQRIQAALIRKYGVDDFDSRIRYCKLEGCHLIHDSEIGEELFRAATMEHNTFEEMQQTREVILMTAYSTWDEQR